MKFEKTFPVWYRAFTHGEIAMLMEQTGGICDLAIVDVAYKNGIPFPDNAYWPIFTRNGGSSGNRPLMGSGIRLLNLSPDGTVDHVIPESPEVFPWGFKSKNMTAFLDTKRIFLQAKKASDSQSALRLCIDENYLFRGQNRSIKSQRNTPISIGNSQYTGTPLDPAQPFPNGLFERTVHAAQVKEHCLLFHETMHLPYGDKEIYFAFYCGDDAVFRKDKNLHFVDTPWQNKSKQTVIISFADTAKDACKNAKTAFAEADTLLQKKCRQDALLSRKAAIVKTDTFPAMTDFFREQNRYLHAFLVGDEIGIRAASYKFSFFAMWDAIFPIRDFLRNGETEQAKKMFRYLLHYPNMEFFPWGSMHLILMLEEILAYQKDDALFAEAWPILKKFIANIRKMTDDKTGLYHDLVNCAVDDNAELGLTGRHYPACLNGFYYNALRTMENFAGDCGEDGTIYHQAWKKLEQHYMPLFYNEQAGYVRHALDNQLKPAKIEVLMNTSVIALEFPFGEWLFGDKIGAIAHYKATPLKHPLGYSAVAYNSPLPCDMWKYVHMNQHLGHEGKLARFAGNTEEIKRILVPYFQHFEKYGVAVETYNLAGCNGNESQVANWQTFSATAASTSIISGLCGIFHHRGGYSYDPADGNDVITLENFRLNGKKLKIRIQGHGKYAVSKFNGISLHGTLQLPVDLPLRKENEWSITRTEICPAEPVLISTHGLPVSAVVSDGNILSFTANRTGTYPMKWSSRGKVQIYVNGTLKATAKTIDLKVKTGDRITLKSEVQ